MNKKGSVVGYALKIILGVLAADLAFYGIWAMGYWNPNPSEWDGLARIVLAVIYTLLLVGAIFAIFDFANTGEVSPVNRSARSRQAWCNKLPLIRSYSEGATIEFNSGLVGSVGEDVWVGVGGRCSFEWPAHYYRIAEPVVQAREAHPVQT